MEKRTVSQAGKLAFTLAEGVSHGDIFNGFHKIAFTLAEVLITLGIIGIVAAMTLPSLVNKVQNKELEVGLKKAYAVIQSAFNQMTYDEGQTVNVSNYPSYSFLPKFKKYFKVVKDCGTNLCERSFPDANGNLGASDNYKTYNNKVAGNTYLDDGQVFIVDGMFLMVENMRNGPFLFITVDVNGYNKKPNRWGHDLFTFQVMPNGKLLPMGADGTQFGSEYCTETSPNALNGIGCTYKALTDKNYFKNLPK